MQALREQRVRSQHLGQLGGGGAVHHGLPYPPLGGRVGAREQGHHDCGGARRLGHLTSGGPRLRTARHPLGRGVGKDRLKGGKLVVGAIQVTDTGIQAGQLGAGDGNNLFRQAADSGGRCAGNSENQRGRALRSHRGFRAAVPSGLARSRHSYRQAGCGPIGGAHGAACYWLCRPGCSGRVRSRGVCPHLSVASRPCRVSCSATTRKSCGCGGSRRLPVASAEAISTAPTSGSPAAGTGLA